jgi:hypothetical protein
MLSRDQQITLWANAYNAALIGLLASKTHAFEEFSTNNVGVITKQCKAFANQAARDVRELEISSLPAAE